MLTGVCGRDCGYDKGVWKIRRVVYGVSRECMIIETPPGGGVSVADITPPVVCDTV